MTKSMLLTGGDQREGRNSPLPKIVVTRAPDDPDSHRHWAAEQIQMKLLTLEEKYRSHVLYQQIKAFEDKIYLCHENFNTELMLTMLRELSKRMKGSKDIYTLAGLRQAFRQEARRLHMRSRNRKPGFQTGHSPDQIMTYFAWFFEYLKYVRELRTNFAERIFNPLFRYFFEVGSNGPDRERSVDSSMSMSNLSLASYGSFDSGLSGLSALTGWSSFAMSDTESQGSSDDIHETRKRMLSRASLLLLGREIRDIRHLYDTTELEKIAQRLSFLKEQVDFLLDNENKISPEMFSQDSENAIHRLNVKNVRTHCFVRLIPDVLVKCQKAAWLARKWLQLDDLKTKNLNMKMEKLAVVEEQLSRRLSVLTKDIQTHEHELEKELTELQKRLKREERSNDLHLAVHEIEDKKVKLNENLEKLEHEKQELKDKMKEATKHQNQKEYKNARTMYERNKLQRYALDRQIATLEFHKSLVAKDMHIELEVKPNLIHFTNDVQDRCEELEQILETEKREKRTLQAALLPISQDKGLLSERMRESNFSTPICDDVISEFHEPNDSYREQKAVYIRSFPSRKSFSGTLPSLPGGHAQIISGRNGITGDQSYTKSQSLSSRNVESDTYSYTDNHPNNENELNRSNQQYSRNQSFPSNRYIPSSESWTGNLDNYSNWS